MPKFLLTSGCLDAFVLNTTGTGMLFDA